MEHEPFETWIIAEMPRDQEQERALQAHLQECARCRQLLQGWKDVHANLGTVAMASPAPGFSQRFQNSLAERRALAQRRQARRTLLGFSSLAIVLFVALVIQLLLVSSPVDWLVKLIEVTLTTLTDLHVLRSFFISWLPYVPISIPLVLWILLSTGFVVLVVGWLFTLWRVTMQGETNK